MAEALAAGMEGEATVGASEVDMEAVRAGATVEVAREEEMAVVVTVGEASAAMTVVVRGVVKVGAATGAVREEEA